MNLEALVTIASSSIVTFILSIFAFKYDLIKIKASASTEVSKSDQEKITTADKTIDLVEKLRATMDKQFEDMSQEIRELKEQIKVQNEKCKVCINNQLP